MRFKPGEIYYHKLDGRRLLYMNEEVNLKSVFKYVGKEGNYLLEGFWDFEIVKIKPNCQQDKTN
jgi:hypothetical protein